MSNPDFFRNPDQYMNVFFLDDDPVIAARSHCDKHVVKMVLETAQILSTVWHTLASKTPEAEWASVLHLDWEHPTADTPFGALRCLHSRLCGNRIYHPTHQNHPSVLWAGLYGGNYEWLYQLGCELLDEYTYRFGKIHACTPVIRALELGPKPLYNTVDTYCEPPPCMPSEYVVDNSAVESYRRYYRKGKTNLMHYTKRPPPDWIADIAIFKGA